jgi:molybdopterin/thiamine biosynthesis adenylyltransferase
MPPTSTYSKTWIELRGTAIPGAEDRQRKIPGFDQEIFSQSTVVCVGAGGIVSHIAPTLVRKGIGHIWLIDHDIVEPSNLNRQRFYKKDIGEYKAVALARNLRRESIVATKIEAWAQRVEDLIECEIHPMCDVVICGVDNNPARVAVSRYFRTYGIPVIFTAVSRDGDHGYVFVQDDDGPCIACVFPDIETTIVTPVRGLRRSPTFFKLSVHWPFTPSTPRSCSDHEPGTIDGSLYLIRVSVVAQKL